MASENIRSEEKHEALKDAVDDVYLGNLHLIGQLEKNMAYNIGTFLLNYQDFQYAFRLLFDLTKNEPGMTGQDKLLIEKIESWLQNGSGIKNIRGKNKKIVKNGIKLAREWNSAIRGRDVIKQ